MRLRPMAVVALFLLQCTSPSDPPRTPDARALVARARAVFALERDGLASHGTGFSFIASHALTVESAGARLVLSGCSTAPYHLEGTVPQRRCGDALEQLERKGARLEQRWHFTRRPEHAVRIRQRVQGLQFAGLDASGAHFEGHGLSVTYGHGTWVDATGRRTAVPVRFDGSELSLEVPDAVVARSSWPAVLDPFITPELDVGGQQAQAYAPEGFQATPSLAISGSKVMAVWSDSRRGDSDIFAATFEAANPNTTARFPVFLGSGDQDYPVVAGGENSFLVVWRERILAGNDQLYGAFVPATLGFGVAPSTLPASFPIALTAGIEDFPAVAYGGAGSNTFLVTWESRLATGQPGTINGLRVTEGVVPNIASAFAIGTDPGDNKNSSVGLNGFNFLVTWINSTIPPAGRILYSRVGVSTAPTAPANLLPASLTSAQHPSVGGNRVGSVVVWEDIRFGLPQVLGLRMDPDGGILDRDGGFQVGAPLPTAVQEIPVAAFDGTNWAIVWREGVQADGGSTLRSRNWTLTGNATNAVSTVFVPRNISPAAGSRLGLSPTIPVVMWSENGPVKAQQLGGVDEIVPVAHSQINQNAPVIASDGTDFLMAWQSLTDAGHDVAWRPVRRDGGLGATVVVKVAAEQFLPAVTSGATQYFAVWSDNRIVDGGFELFGARIGRDGTPVDDGGVRLTSLIDSELSPQVAFDGTQYVLAWNHFGFRVPVQFTINIGAVATVNPATLVTTAPVPLLDGGRHPPGAIASTGAGQTLIVTQSAPDLNFTMFSGAAQSTPGNVTSSYGGGVTADFDGTDYLVVWVDTRNAGTTGNDLYGARITTAGVVRDLVGVALDQAPGDPSTPRVTFNGSNHLLTWSTEPNDGGLRDVQGKWFTRALAPVSALAQASADDEHSPAVASNDAGESLLGYVHFKPFSPALAPRVVAALAATGTGATCILPGDCASNACVNGVCCDRACTGVCETCLGSEGATRDGVCGPRPITFVCRASTDLCDHAETCDGTAACPADVLEPGTTPCRASAGDCDVVELCDGVTAVCPANRKADAGTVCASTTQLCAAAGTCDGTNVVCNSVGALPADTVCRDAGGVCDVPEVCDGLSLACPINAFKGTATVCRPTAGQSCDTEEVCSGGAADCPPDAVADTTKSCRDAVSVCDVPEVCDGVNKTCPANAFAAATVVCAGSSNPCEVAASCSGSSTACPAVAPAPDGTDCGDGQVCRAGACQPRGSAYGFGCGNCSAGGPGLFALVALLALRRRRLGGALVVLCCALVASPAFAAGRLKLAYLGIRPTSGVSDDSAKSLSEFTQTELVGVDAYDVISPSDIAAQLGIERQKQLLGCSTEGEGSCMAELLGALNAARAVQGDVSRVDDIFVVNLTLLDLTTGQPIHRVAARVESKGGISGVFDAVTPLLYELAGKDPALAGRTIAQPRGFGGLVVGIRADGDVLGLAVAPGITVEYSTRWFGAGLTVLPKATPGVRLEGRFYPIERKRIRAMVGVGSTAFTTAIAVRAAAGAALRFGQLQVFLDVAYERFLYNPRKLLDNAVLVGLGAGWQF